MSTSDVTDLQILVGARAAISKPEHWCKGRTRKLGNNPNEDAFCSLGALQHVARLLLPHGDHRLRQVSLMSKLRAPGFNPNDIVGYNDAPSTTHDDILKMFDDAIEREIYANVNRTLTEGRFDE